MDNSAIYENIMMTLLNERVITFDDYLKIRTDYTKRNKYLDLFTMGPRVFGQNWGENHLLEIVSSLQKPSKDLDKDFVGEYDLWYQGIKIEVKASRAVDASMSKTPLPEKAICFGTSKRFSMNFQQLKPYCCHVFVWIAVWKDTITYWVLSSEDVNNNKYKSPQHRGNEDEWQIIVTKTKIRDFDQYVVTSDNLLNTIVEKYNSLANKN